MLRYLMLCGLLLPLSSMARDIIPGIGTAGMPPIRAKVTVSHFKEVKKDTMEAVFRAEAEERDLNRLASMVKEQVSWAVGVAQESPYFQVSTGDYQVYAIYDRYEPPRFSHWWGAQLVRIKSTHIEALRDAIGKLQSRLMLLAIHYGLSPKARHQAEEGLLQEAMDVYRSRILLLQDKIKARAFTILDLDISPVEEDVTEDELPFQRLSLTIGGNVEFH